MPFWAWLVLGMLLLGGEMLTPGGFYLLFFGFGALCVGILGLVAGEIPVWVQWLLFTLLSVGSLVLLRPRLLGRMHSGGTAVDDGLVGEVALAKERIEPGGFGQGELRGSVWTLRNAGGAALTPGARARVERVEGLTLDVRQET